LGTRSTLWRAVALVGSPSASENHLFTGGSRVARPGLEPGTPRFSGAAREESNDPKTPANTPVCARHMNPRYSRYLRAFLSRLGTETARSAQWGAPPTEPALQAAPPTRPGTFRLPLSINEKREPPKPGLRGTEPGSRSCALSAAVGPFTGRARCSPRAGALWARRAALAPPTLGLPFFTLRAA
jgi:hypothetical protein